IAHIRFLCENYFSDKRYIRINGKPFISIYRPSLFPDIKQTLITWREEAAKFGMELNIGFMQGFVFEVNFTDFGFDCAIEFHPTYSKMESATEEFPWQDKLLHKLGLNDSVYYTGKVISYKKYADQMMSEQVIRAEVYPGLTPMWDSTARHMERALIFKDSSPDLYAKWLKSIVDKYRANPQQNEFIFINAWNEWAEGNHLEPCLQWGRKYLEATKKALE
ncbi:MAG: glycoside hydrolase family 99-like domain-containing protein, partial [Chitinophagales bacterium]